jgi:hypothetical protein
MNDVNFADMLNQHVKSAVDLSVQEHIADFINQLSLDPNWVNRIETLINQNFVTKFTRELSAVDVSSLIAENLDGAIERWNDKLTQNFRTVGIADNATQQQLTITDEMIVSNTNLVAPHVVANALHVAENASIDGNLEVKNLIVKGVVNTDNNSWNEVANFAANIAVTKLTDEWRQNLINDVLEKAKTDGISFEKIIIQGSPIIDGNKLNSTVTVSNIQQVGILKSLDVSGDVSLNQTLKVNRGRIGINTDSPEMALSIWDEEVSVIAGKFSKDVAYVGTSRNQTLALGVNRQSHVTVDPDGLTTVKKFRIDKWILGYTATAPGWSGTRGDFYFNSDPKPDQPMAWVCLGGFRWQQIKGIA